MIDRKNKFINFFEAHSFLFSSFMIPALYILIKTLYIKGIAQYYELDIYYFNYITLDQFFSTMFIFIIFLFSINFYKIFLGSESKMGFYTFILIIFPYYILSILIIINNKILPQKTCIFFVCIFIILAFGLKKFSPLQLICSIILSIAIIIINFSSIKLKKEYEIATLKTYQKVAILTLQDSDYLVVPFEEKDNILYLKTKDRRWINKLDFINIQSKKYQQVKINSAPI